MTPDCRRTFEGSLLACTVSAQEQVGHTRRDSSIGMITGSSIGTITPREGESTCSAVLAAAGHRRRTCDYCGSGAGRVIPSAA
jgi:hypothetical protein